MAVAALLTACGGGGTPAPSPTPGPAPAPGSNDPKPLTGPQDFTVEGVVYDEGVVKAAKVTAYSTAGVACGSATADESGKYKVTGKCTFPVVLAADVPDANDTSGEATSGEGRKLFASLPVIMNKNEAFEANLSQASRAVTLLAAGKVPEPGTTTPATVLTVERQAKAVEKVKSIAEVIATKLGYSSIDLLKGSTKDGEALGDVLRMAPMSFERIESTKQTVIRFHVVTEHRPIALVYTDGKSIEEAVVDTGLGMSTEEIVGSRLKDGLATANELKAEIGSGAWPIDALTDACFLHNGGTSIRWLLDAAEGFPSQPNASAENVKLLRLNTYVDQDNETLEKRNAGPATLAYVSFDFKNSMGLKQRAYSWAIKGSQDVNGCFSEGPSGWRILGNQRKAYSKVTTYATHATLYNQAFGSRTDNYGTGVELNASYPTEAGKFTHLLISGPGLPTDGVVFIYVDGGFLYSTNTLLSIRSTATKPGATTDDILAAILPKVKDTKSMLFATDATVKKVTDAYYDRQNTYTVRLFRDYADLFPSVIYQDILPKRPYLVSELKPDMFHSVGVNIDRLVQSLQVGEGVDVNWSLPNDLRGVKLKPRRVWISRLNCLEAKTWPGCTKRSAQFNEWSVSPEYFSDPLKGGTTLTPWAIAVPGALTFKGIVRVELVDSLNRPLETSIGMDYTR